MKKNETTEEVSSFGGASSETLTESVPLDGTETSTTVEVKLAAGRVCSVAFDLGEITPRLRKSISSLGDADEDKAEGAMIDLLARIVTDWTYTTKRGKAVDIDADAIADHVSLRDLSAIVSGIFTGTSSPNDNAGEN